MKVGTRPDHGAFTAIDTGTALNHGPSFEMPAPVHSASCTHWQPKIHSSKGEAEQHIAVVFEARRLGDHKVKRRDDGEQHEWRQHLGGADGRSDERADEEREVERVRRDEPAQAQRADFGSSGPVIVPGVRKLKSGTNAARRSERKPSGPKVALRPIASPMML